jgi:hypothetical protein
MIFINNKFQKHMENETATCYIMVTVNSLYVLKNTGAELQKQMVQ